MVQAIGIMMGFYILTRMIDLIARSGERQAHVATRIFAVITFLITILMLFVLVVSDMKLQEGL